MAEKTVRTISHKTLKKWKWYWTRSGTVISHYTAFGKARTSQYTNGIGRLIEWAKPTERLPSGKFPHSDGWIYFSIGERKYKSPLK